MSRISLPLVFRKLFGGRKQPRLIKAFLGNRLPRLAGQDRGIEFLFPQNFKRLTLVVIIDTGQSDHRAVRDPLWLDYIFDQVRALTNACDLARRWKCDYLAHVVRPGFFYVR